MPQKRKVIPVGTRNGRLVVIDNRPFYNPTSTRKRYQVKCRCNCGTEKYINTDNFPKTYSCGCYNKEKCSERMKEINKKRLNVANLKHNGWKNRILPTGVYIKTGKRKKKYDARIYLNGKCFSKNFATLPEAHEWRVSMEQKRDKGELGI